jgi:hypothetical protein
VTVSTPWKHSSSFRTSHVMQSLDNCNAARSSLHHITYDVVSCFMETHKIRRISSHGSSSAFSPGRITSDAFTNDSSVCLHLHSSSWQAWRTGSSGAVCDVFNKSTYPDVDKARADQWISMYSVIDRSNLEKAVFGLIKLSLADFHLASFLIDEVQVGSYGEV